MASRSAYVNLLALHFMMTSRQRPIATITMSRCNKTLTGNLPKYHLQLGNLLSPRQAISRFTLDSEQWPLIRKDHKLVSGSPLSHGWRGWTASPKVEQLAVFV